MNLHKVYAGAIAGVVVLAVVIGSAWSSHVKDEAQRDAVIESQKVQIADIEKKRDADLKALHDQLDAISQQKAQIIKVPSEAPDVLAQLLREMNPKAAPIQQTAPITKEMAPDAPSAVLTKQNQIDLAEAALTCKQCFLEKSQLQSEVADQQKVIDGQKTELAAAVKASKGGSIWQRSKTILKWAAIGFAAGVVIDRSHK